MSGSAAPLLQTSDRSSEIVLAKRYHPRAAFSDLAFAHDKQLGHGHAHLSARSALRGAGKFCHDDVALLDHTYDLQLWRVDERGRPVDGLVVCFLACQLEGAEDGPLDVVGQAGQDLPVIVTAESV